MDGAIAAIAGRQLGLVTRHQLTAAGLGRGGIDLRVANGRLLRVHRGVYLVGHRAAPPLQRELAAVLACGSGTLVSCRSAAELCGLLREPRHGPVHVTVPGRRVRHRPGVVVHNVAALEQDEIGTCRGVPVTAPARTLLDLARVAPIRELERAADEALVLGLATRGQIEVILARYSGQPGAAILSTVIELAEPLRTRSRAEELFLGLVRGARLPLPETNVWICGYEVDALWRGRRLIMEIDGYRYHSSRSAFERDRRKSADLEAAGWRVLRTTWRELQEERTALAARLGAALLG